MHFSEDCCCCVSTTAVPAVETNSTNDHLTSDHSTSDDSIGAEVAGDDSTDIALSEAWVDGSVGTGSAGVELLGHRAPALSRPAHRRRAQPHPVVDGAVLDGLLEALVAAGSPAERAGVIDAVVGELYEVMVELVGANRTASDHARPGELASLSPTMIEIGHHLRRMTTYYPADNTYPAGSEFPAGSKFLADSKDPAVGE